MQIVIDIHEKDYQCMLNGDLPYSVIHAIQNGTPLDKHDEELIKETVASIWGEPCDDYVKREDVKSGMIKYGFLAPDMTVTEFVEDELPSVTPQPKRGKWIEKTGEGFDAWAECSECGCVNPFEDDFNYCPNCGADMRGVKADDES